MGEIFSWLRDERFAIIELTPNETAAVFLRVDADKRIILERFVREASRAQFQRALHRFKVIIAADPALTVTALLPGTVHRQDAHEPISASEFENFLAETVGRLFTQCRASAAAELGVRDLEVVPVASRVRGFRVDGHRVLNPVGFRARRIEVLVELTLTTQGVIDRVNGLVDPGSAAFFTEAARSELEALSKMIEPPVHLVRSRNGSTKIFSLVADQGAETIFRSSLPWSVDQFGRALVQALSIGPGPAWELYERFRRGDVSGRAATYFESVFTPILEGFSREVKKAGLAGPVYLDFDRPLPLEFPHYGRGFVLWQLPLSTLLAKTGFTIDSGDWPVPPEGIFGHVAPLFEYYFDRSDTRANQWLRRRLHWLGAASRTVVPNVLLPKK